MSSINQFKAGYLDGGARTQKFRVKINNPVNPAADIAVPLLCHAASLPEYNVKALDVAFQGRRIKVAGSKEYGDWQVKIYNDENFKLRNAFERWMDFMNANEGNVNQFGNSRITNYKSLAEVDQLSQTDQVLRTYKMVGIFPTRVDSIDLDWGDENIQSFGVTFAIDYFYVSGSVDGLFAGDR